MGNRLTDEESQQTESQTYDNIFDELFPHYLMMGMTPEQYWDGESSLKPAFRKAYQMRMEQEQKMADRNNWFMGQYIMCVLQAVPLLVGGLNVKNTTRLPEYPKEPFLEKYEAEKKEADRKKQEEDRMKLTLALFQQGIMKFNKRMETAGQPVNSGQ